MSRHIVLIPDPLTQTNSVERGNKQLVIQSASYLAIA